jgi:hypothetical protein
MALTITNPQGGLGGPQGSLNQIPPGVANATYSWQMLATGGTPPYTWTNSMAPWTLYGLSMSSTGLISGTVAAGYNGLNGMGTFTVTDSALASVTSANYQMQFNPSATFVSLAASPTTLTLKQGETGTAWIGVSGNTLTALAVSGVPTGATASVSPTTQRGGASVVLTVDAGTAAGGTYPITVTGTQGAATQTVNVAVTIAAGVRPQPTPPPGMTLQRTLTVEVYAANGKAPMFFVDDGASYREFLGSEVGVQRTLQNLLHKRPPTAASATIPTVVPPALTLQRTISVEVYGSGGLAPMFFVSDDASSFRQFQPSEVGVQTAVRNLLHPPAPTKA